MHRAALPGQESPIIDNDAASAERVPCLMTELEVVRASEVPRAAEICRKLAARVRPALGFVVYGALILPFAVPAAGLGPLLAMLYAGSLRFDVTPFPQYWLIPSYVVALTCATLPLIAFGRWVKRLRGEAFALVRDGELVDAKVTQARKMYARGGPLTSARVELPGGAEAALSVSGHPEALTEGAMLPGLARAGADVCLVFLDGTAAPAKLRLNPRVAATPPGARGSTTF
jgi:hypothetical protein